MKKYVYILLLFFFTTYSQSHNSHYKGLAKIEMEVFRNNDLIGYSNYFFEHNENALTVKNYTQFKVKLFGATIFSISSEAIEKYENNKLVYFSSRTTQNNKKKFVKLELNENTNKFIINGSSFKGETDTDKVIGNWWNVNILSATSQISPLSGSIKEQVVKLIKEEIITINGKSYETLKFQLKSKNQDLPEDKKLDFEIWLDVKKRFLVKISYERMGKWEYIINNYK